MKHKSIYFSPQVEDLDEDLRAYALCTSTSANATAEDFTVDGDDISF